MISENLKNRILQILQNRRIVILGYGNEGKSSLAFLSAIFPKTSFVIADKNQDFLNDNFLIDYNLFCGENYLAAIAEGDFVMKSPGISFKNFKVPNEVIISSQTDLFLQLFGKQTIGVTGTKGKSTTASLIFHILNQNFKSVFLVGNIGIPALNIASEIHSDSIIVYELSSHQLEFCVHSPHISILLNLHQEHLDHYADYRGYRYAKWKITENQTADDYFIYNGDDETVNQDLAKSLSKSKKLSVSLLGDRKSDLYFIENEIYELGLSVKFHPELFQLRGNHNIFNLMVSIKAAQLVGLNLQQALQSAYSFSGLPHRIEYVGQFNEIHFYNDSIATIPEAAINALKAIDEVETLILGGYDRGIDYQILIDFLFSYKSINILLLGRVGDRLWDLFNNATYHGNYQKVDSLQEAVSRAYKLTKKHKAVLLSPAAASYDSFRNFEERGEHFKRLVVDLSKINL